MGYLSNPVSAHHILSYLCLRHCTVCPSMPYRLRPLSGSGILGHNANKVAYETNTQATARRNVANVTSHVLNLVFRNLPSAKFSLDDSPSVRSLATADFSCRNNLAFPSHRAMWIQRICCQECKVQRITTHPCAPSIRQSFPEGRCKHGVLERLHGVHWLESVPCGIDDPPGSGIVASRVGVRSSEHRNLSRTSLPRTNWLETFQKTTNVLLEQRGPIIAGMLSEQFSRLHTSKLACEARNLMHCWNQAFRASQAQSELPPSADFSPRNSFFVNSHAGCKICRTLSSSMRARASLVECAGFQARG